MEYAILGIQPYSDTSKPGLCARVRMFVGEQVVDQDFDLPELPPGVAPSDDVYGFLLKDTIEAQITQLQGASS